MGECFGKSFIYGLSTRKEEGIAIVQTGEKSYEKGRPAGGIGKYEGIVSYVNINLEDQVEGGTTYTNLAHELAHSQDRLNGTMNNKDLKRSGFIQAEIYATHVENLVRAEHKETSIRRYYGGKAIVDYKGSHFKSKYFKSKDEYLGTQNVVNEYLELKSNTGYVYR